MLRVFGEMMNLTGALIAPRVQWGQIDGRSPEVGLKPTCFAGYFRRQGPS